MIFIFIFIIIQIASNTNKTNKLKRKIKYEEKRNFDQKNLINHINIFKEPKIINKVEECFISINNSTISHFIITRFLIDIIDKNGQKKNYTKEYIINGIRVMKKYLLSSLDNQKCKNFIWILMIGNNEDITYIKSIFNFMNSFEYDIVNQKNLKNYIRDKSNNSDILITTRIDYDDIIYYDAVNDIRKTINMNKPIIIHGYNQGLYYFELNNKYYAYDRKIGVSSVFTSLVLILNKVNNIYTIYDIGPHTNINTYLFKKYKSFGVKELDYIPFVFDSGASKFIKVIQKYSETRNLIKKYIKDFE